MVEGRKLGPGRFGSLADARDFSRSFIEDCNHHHRHGGIGYHSPASVQFGGPRLRGGSPTHQIRAPLLQERAEALGPVLCPRDLTAEPQIDLLRTLQRQVGTEVEGLLSRLH